MLLGDLGKRLPILRSRLEDNGYALHLVADLAELRDGIRQLEPQILVVAGNENREFSGQASLQKALGTTAILTRRLVPHVADE